jgi:hypothetical protein
VNSFCAFGKEKDSLAQPGEKKIHNPAIDVVLTSLTMAREKAIYIM